ncbi:MAG: serine protease, partial [Bdellovibrionales bacterium]|nr:serine protease [Bdellovibrionales bacterium]
VALQSSYEIQNLGRFRFTYGSPGLQDSVAWNSHQFFQGVSQFITYISENPALHDQNIDLVVVKHPRIENGFLPVSDQLRVDEEVFVVHHPDLSQLQLEPGAATFLNSLGPFVSIGRVKRVLNRMAHIDAFASVGSSSGTVLNARGELVGIISFGFEENGKTMRGMMRITPEIKQAIEGLRRDNS